MTAPHPSPALPRFAVEAFRPSPTIRNPHAQTLSGMMARTTVGVTFRRERLTTPDGDFVDLDYADVQGAPWDAIGEDAPVVLVMHGLEGNARDIHNCEMYRHLAYRGLRPVGLNQRGCSGEPNSLPRTYHAGTTDDLAHAVAHLHARYPDVPLGLAGFSLGANVVLKYLGEHGPAARDHVRAAAVISPPFDLAATVRFVERGTGRLYARRMLNKMRAKVQAKAAHLTTLEIDASAALRARSVHDWDTLWTAPLYGFADAEAYYHHASSGRYLANVMVPTLVMRAADDPMFDPHDIPHAVLDANPFLVAAITQRGGHNGFVEGDPRRGWRFWAERQAGRFLAKLL